VTGSDEAVLYEVRDTGVAWLTLNRPEVGNAIAPPQRNRIIELMGEAGNDPAVRAVLITGAGDRHFSTGGDLRHPDAVQEDGADPHPSGWVSRLIESGVQPLMTSILDCDKPVVAAVNGTAAGIGSHLALACDLVVASEDAVFIEIFIRRGLVMDGAGAFLLSRLVGLHVAKELVFLGDELAAGDAARLGLVNHVVPHDEVLGVAGGLAERLATMATVPIGLMKRLLNAAYDQDRSSALRDEALACEVNSRSRDFDEGLRAFAERRPPVWTGR